MQERFRRWLQTGNWRRQAWWIIGLALIAAAIIGGWGLTRRSSEPMRLVVYAFSTQQETLSHAIFPQFQQAWESQTGRQLVIEGIFGPSGTLAGQINLGAPADVALLSHAQHVNWLKLGKQVRWETDPIVLGFTPIVIVTRAGNPAGITSLEDLAAPGLRLLHADPRSAGAGEWSVLAEYGSALLETGSPEHARAQLSALWQNVRLLAPSARATMTLFELGAGDAFLTYEQDARLAQERGVPLEIVIPRRTLLAQHVAVLIDGNVRAWERPVAEAFLQFLTGDEGQRILGEYHLRPALVDHSGFPPIAEPFTVEDLGGWSVAHTQLVDELWRTEIEPRLELAPLPTLLGPGDGS